MLQELNVIEIRQNLEKELERLLANHNKQQGQRSGSNPDRDDLAHSYIRQERRLALQDVEETQVAQIKEALKRIDDGVYGTCASCGENIELERLEIIPYATLCVNCQQAQTKNKGV
jgi:DnaK suppressor protein